MGDCCSSPYVSLPCLLEEEEPEEDVDILVLINKNLEYLEELLSYKGELDESVRRLKSIKSKVSEKVLDPITDYLVIKEIIQDTCYIYEEADMNIASLRLYYQLLKLTKKLGELTYKRELIDICNHIMILNSSIGNYEQARELFLHIQELNGYSLPYSSKSNIYCCKL